VDGRQAGRDAAFANQTVVKATLMRITLHAVHAEDYPAFHNAMLPSLRAARLSDRRFIDTGLSVAEADALIPELLEFTARPRTGAEVEELLRARLGDRKPRVWWALRTFAPLLHVPSGGPWSFGSGWSFVAARTKLGPEAQDESMQRLVLRYLQAFGPASVQDFAQFTMLRRPVVLQRCKPWPAGLNSWKARTGKRCSMCPRRRNRPRTPPPPEAAAHVGPASCWPTPTAAG
jgi:winged helix DNA-binding protein